MKSLAELFGNRCYVTHEPFKVKGFVLHHIREIPNDVLRSNYPKTPMGREQYLIDLEHRVRKNPEDFALIKNGIHTKLDHNRNGVTRLKMENRKRFCELALKTIHIKKSRGKRKI